MSPLTSIKPKLYTAPQTQCYCDISWSPYTTVTTISQISKLRLSDIK
jgi:hypothetical protein